MPPAALYKKYQPIVARAQASKDQNAYYLALREYTHTMRDGHVSVKPDDMTVYHRRWRVAGSAWS